MSLVDERTHLQAVPEPDEAVDTRRFAVVEGGINRAAQALRVLGATLVVTIVIGLVGALAVHATIIKNQRHLDQQQARIDRLAAETEALQHELAELEAPARIVAEARELGMIDAPAVTYLHDPGGLLDERTLVVAENQLRAG